MSTEDLQSLDGIGETTAQKLIEAGVPTPVALASCTPARLIAIGITKAAAVKYIKLARNRCSAIFGFVTGQDLVNQFKRREILTSGTEGLDNILYDGKGFETQKVYEIYGPEGTGKSNLLHQLVCTAFLPPDRGGLGAGTIYIDTEGSFSIRRIKDIAMRLGIDPDEIIPSIIKSTPPTSDVLLYLCEAELEMMAHETGARLFCLDSIATHFRAEYGTERQMLPERQQKANKVIHALKRVAQQANGVSILTNQVTANVNRRNQYAPKYFHAMGNVVGHESQVRIHIKIKSEVEKTRTLKIEKALDLPPEEVVLRLTDEGLMDLPTKSKAKPASSIEGAGPKPEPKPKSGTKKKARAKATT